MPPPLINPSDLGTLPVSKIWRRCFKMPPLSISYCAGIWKACKTTLLSLMDRMDHLIVLVCRRKLSPVWLPQPVLPLPWNPGNQLNVQRRKQPNFQRRNQPNFQRRNQLNVQRRNQPNFQRRNQPNFQRRNPQPRSEPTHFGYMVMHNLGLCLDEGMVTSSIKKNTPFSVHRKMPPGKFLGYEPNLEITKEK